MKLKQTFALLMAFCMFALTLTGCGSKADETALSDKTGSQEGQSGEDKDKTAAMGRYVEQSIKLPELTEQESILGIVQFKEETVLYTFQGQTETAGSYLVYRQQPDGSWSKEESVWLNASIGAKKQLVLNIRTGGEDSLYALYLDGSYKPHIIKTMDENSVAEVKVSDFETEGIVPNGFAVTGKGEIAVSYLGGSISDSIVLYDGTSGSELKRFATSAQSTDNICSLMDADGTKLVVVNEENSGFTVYDTDTGEVVEELNAEFNKPSGAEGIILIGKNEEYYHLSPRGLSRFQSGGSIMEILIDGSLNTIGMEGMRHKTLLPGEDQTYRILYQDGNDYEFDSYAYDSKVTAVPEVQLTMYGLTKNSSVSRAIGAFQKENPDVAITYYTAQAEQGATTTEDMIRTLNTELLSGKGADILLLDGLPVESYMEKGVLTDISDILTPMITAGEVPGNMTESYTREDGSIYGIPVRFSIPVLVGDQETCEAFQSLETLRKYAAEHIGREFISYCNRTMTYDELAEFILTANYREIIGDGTKLDQAVLLRYLETVQAVGLAIGATGKQVPKPPTTEADLKSMADWNAEFKGDAFAFNYGHFPIEDGMVQGCEIKGINDMLEPVGMQEQFGKKITSVNSQYIPSGIIGINSSSSHIQEAKNFIKCILSDEQQSKDLGGGMPVNTAALEGYGSKDPQYSMGASFLFKGKEIHLAFEWPTDEEIKGITDLGKTLTEPLNVDLVFKEMILSESKQFFAGSITADRAAEAIFNKAKTYLAE